MGAVGVIVRCFRSSGIRVSLICGSGVVVREHREFIEMQPDKHSRKTAKQDEVCLALTGSISISKTLVST